MCQGGSVTVLVPTSAYRLARAYAVRLLGVAAVASGLAVVLLVLARSLDAPGLVTGALLVVAIALGAATLLAVDGAAGAGWLRVRLPDGRQALTRDGRLQLDGTGRLMTSTGALVQPPVTAPRGVAADEVEIGADGTISSSQGVRGRLRLVRFADAQALKNEGANLFSSTAQAQPAGATSRVEPGAIERSNVKPVLEMSRLMEVNRSYTSVANMLSKMDELRRSAIQRLAEPV